MKLRSALALTLFAGIWLAACSNAADAATAAPTQPLMPYQTSTTTLIATLAEATVAAPSATPQVYVVVSGDTLFAIAARYEITVEVLRAANPSVDPLLLSPGIELVIPVAGAGFVSPLPSPTPVAAQLGPVDCYSSALGELWCFFPIQNDNEEPLENLIGTVHLLSKDGDVLVSLEAIPPLNILPPGQAMPLVAYASRPPLDWAAARGQLRSAYSLVSENDYYLNAELVGVDIEIAESGLSARVTGRVRVASEQQPEELWLLAVAYDVDRKVVGMRRWASTGETEFDFWVYSLGPQIAGVELLVEARP